MGEVKTAGRLTVWHVQNDVKEIPRSAWFDKPTHALASINANVPESIPSTFKS
jgi:hypothetical protein